MLRSFSELFAFWAHTDAIRCIEVHPHSNLFLTSSDDETIRYLSSMIFAHNLTKFVINEPLELAWLEAKANIFIAQRLCHVRSILSERFYQAWLQRSTTFCNSKLFHFQSISINFTTLGKYGRDVKAVEDKWNSRTDVWKSCQRI